MDGLRVLRVCSVFEPPGGGPDTASVAFDPVGGMQTHTGELTRALDALGVTQTVVTTRPPGTPRRAAFGSRAEVVRLGLPVPRCRQFYAVPAARLLPRLAASADVVHAHLGEDLAVVPLALTAVARRRLPLVLTVHTSVRYTLTVRDARTALLKTLGGWWEDRGERHATHVIALTPRLAALLTAHGIPPERVRVIPSGVRAELFASPHGADPLTGLPRPRVVFLGRLHVQKNVALLLVAAALLRHPAHVVLVGDGPARRDLEQLRDRLGLARRVTFLGFLGHDRVPALLRATDVLVMPSRYEELGTALLEALHCGVPVVATRTGGIPDVITDGVNGLLAASGDADGLAAAIDRLLADPALGRRLGECGRLRAADYRWDRLAGKVLGVYRSALTPRR
ncbi:MAG TPA: glycosyltransferase family 4 protein [Mycobacteriales bacterium]|nr:glycosyltransferase family 4 protein [Mycobacteriales bacterium]